MTGGQHYLRKHCHLLFQSRSVSGSWKSNQKKHQDGRSQPDSHQGYLAMPPMDSSLSLHPGPR
ncbi:hypothetical protein DPMN_068478 [Dreissena polymorpha]|uniref:Uncharacterized protein n=1 Tax=Dreissena polymorpha TaxID=45954 RepID=A0A9D3YXQ0_DREPO|nr:hypothetical protein DPMN_068478 [Dreissena polymorpha]